MENIGFVNDVKSLILQLGCVRGALLSDNYLVKDSAEKIEVPGNAGIALPMDPLGIHNMENSSAYMADSYTQQRYSFQASSIVGQPSPSPKENQNNQETTALTCQAVNMNPLPSSRGNTCQPSCSLLVKPKSPFGGQLRDGVAGAEVIPSRSKAWLNQQASSYKGRSGLNNTFGLFQSGNKIFSSVSTNNLADDNKLVSNSSGTSHMRSNGSLPTDHNISSANIPVPGGSQINDGINSFSGPLSVPFSVSKTHMEADVNLSGAPSAGIELRKAEALKTEEVSSCVTDQIVIGDISKGFDSGQFSKDVKISGNGLTPSEPEMDNDFFKALNTPFLRTKEHIFSSDHFPDFIHGYQNLDNARCSGFANAKLEEQCTRPSGDDLFDILGMDFKNKLLNCHGLDENTQDIRGITTSTFINTKDLDSNLFSAKEGISDAGFFSGTGTDHLLDAVVSKAHFSAKQSSEDNLSCRTTLTKISTSSVPSSSPTFGRVNLANHMQAGKLQLREAMNKPGMVKTSSFKSGCSRDDAGNCSQTSGYGSQISSWVEQGSCVKHDNSASTAYSKRPDEIGKSNRKRLKPGENPRPRPKDRQMIQDRVKELREIVPNGAKVIHFSFPPVCFSSLVFLNVQQLILGFDF